MSIGYFLVAVDDGTLRLVLENMLRAESILDTSEIVFAVVNSTACMAYSDTIHDY